MGNRTVRFVASFVAALLPAAALAQVFPYFPPPGITYSSSSGQVNGTATGGAQGAGTINAQGLYVNGTSVNTSVATVTSVALADTSSTAIYSITGSPITSSGTLDFSLKNETANYVLAGPTSGSAVQPTFRALVGADLPLFSSSLNGAVPSSGGGTSSFLRADGSWATPGSGGSGGGSVTSVALTVPSWLSVSGSPVTTSGTLAVSATGSETANEFLATPNGSTGAVGLRSIVGADLPAPGASTLGGIESFASVSHEWINAISTSGVPSATQPACGDLSNAAASCSTDATNATNITSGTLAIGEGGTGSTTSPTNGQIGVSNSGGTAYLPTSLHKAYGFYYNGACTSPCGATYVFLYVVPTHALTVPSGAGASSCVAGVAATGSTTFTVKKNGSSVGTGVYAASGTTCSWTWSSSTTWNGSSDILEIDGPGTADATLANFSIIVDGTTTAP